MTKIRVSEIRVSKIRVSKIRVSKINVSEIRVSKIRLSEIRVSEIRVSEIRISSNHRELHGAIFLGGGVTHGGYDVIFFCLTPTSIDVNLPGVKKTTTRPPSCDVFKRLNGSADVITSRHHPLQITWHGGCSHNLH